MNDLEFKAFCTRHALKIVLKTIIKYCIVWNGWKNAEQCIKFLEDFDEVNIEYSNGDWIIRYNKTYKTLHLNDVIIRIGKNRVAIIPYTEFKETFEVLTNFDE